MKQCVAIAVLFAILAQTFSKDLIVAHFYLNRDYITAHYCKNKDQPEMHCRGACHLKKTLKKEQQRDSRLLLQDRHDITLYYAIRYIAWLPLLLFPEREPYRFYNDRAQKNYPNPVFHPPAAFI